MAPAKTKASARSPYFWNDEETEFMLVQLKEMDISKFMDGRKTRNGNLFKKVQEKMAKVGYTRTPEQIRIRWKHLKLAFLNAKKNNKANSRTPVSCHFYKILDELLSHSRPVAQDAGEPEHGEESGFMHPVSESSSGGGDVLDTAESPLSQPAEPSSSSIAESIKCEPTSTLMAPERNNSPDFPETTDTPVMRRTQTRGRRRVTPGMSEVLNRLEELQNSWMRTLQQSQDREERLVNSILESNQTVMSALLEGIRCFQPPVQPPDMDTTEHSP